jgi:phosphoglycolate phosphatase
MPGSSGPPAARFAAILFDLDGTLLDTVPDLAIAANRMLAELGCEALPEQDIARFVGRGITNLVERTLQAAGIAKALKADALNLFERFYAEESGRRSRPYPGVTESLAHLREAQVPMGVVTNKAAVFTMPLLETTGLHRFFTAVVSGDTTPWKKPDPRPVLHACGELGAAPARTLYIGDSIHDVRAGHAAGCAVWCVPYGYNEGQPIEAAGADRVVAGLTEVAERLLAPG